MIKEIYELKSGKDVYDYIDADWNLVKKDFSQEPDAGRKDLKPFHEQIANIYEIKGIKCEKDFTDATELGCHHYYSLKKRDIFQACRRWYAFVLL